MLDEARNIAALLRRGRPENSRPRFEGGLSTAFGCTYEGAVPADRVVRLAELLCEAGCDEVGLADSVGYANPAQVQDLVKRVRAAIGTDRFAGLHLHNTRGLGLANVVAGLEVGVHTFDSSMGGIGGCPFAPGATGNIVTEDLVFMLEAMGYRTGIDLARLMRAREILAAAVPNEELYGYVRGGGSAARLRAGCQRSQRMTACFSLAHLTMLNLSPPELIEVAARAGYQFVSLRPIPVGAPNEPLHPFATDRALRARTKAALNATGVGLLDIEVARIVKEVTPRSYLPALEAAAELGGRHVLSSAWCDDGAYIREFFAELCDLADPFGLTVDLEFVTWSGVRTLNEAVDIVQKQPLCQRRHRHRHAAFRSLPRGPAQAGEPAARVVSLRADQRCAGTLLHRARRTDSHRSGRTAVSRRRRHRHRLHPRATAGHSAVHRDSEPGQAGDRWAPSNTRACVSRRRAAYLAASAFRRAV